MRSNYVLSAERAHSYCGRISAPGDPVVGFQHPGQNLRLSTHVIHLALPASLLASVLALSGCDWQTSWSREYHLRQYEEWRTLGDRSRVSESYSLAQAYYQKSLEDLEQSGATPVQLAQGIQDVAETDLLANKLDDAVLGFERALRIYKSQKPSESENFALARCLTGYGVALLKRNRTAEAIAILSEAEQKNAALRQSDRRKDDPFKTLACGWAPQLCEHSCKYWLALCKDPALNASSTKSVIAGLLEDPSLCGPVKQLLAKSYIQVLRKAHDEKTARKVEDTFDIMRDLDTADAALIQHKWESASKQGKKFEENGDAEKARLAYEKALQISAEAIYACPVRRIASLCNLAFFYANSGNPLPAVPLLRECVDIQQARFGDSDRALAMPRSRYGSALLGAGQLEKADPEIRKGYELALKWYGKDSPFTARTECILAALELAENKFADAEQHVNHALSILAKEPQRNERVILEGKLNLVDIYNRTGAPEKSLRAANDAASFAQENATYFHKVKALEKLVLISREQHKRDSELQALRREMEVITEALSNAKWRKWAEKQLRILNMEFSQLNSGGEKKVQQ